MNQESNGQAVPVNPQKSRRGLLRMWHAARYSVLGLRAAWAMLQARYDRRGKGEAS